MEKRIPGLLIGISILGSIFIIPFTFRGARPLTLFETTMEVKTFLGDVQRLIPQYLLLNYVFIAAFILLALGGLMGMFPIVSGVLSVTGMASLSIAMFFVGAQIPWGLGYYILWALSIAALGNYVWDSQRSRIRHTKY